MMTFPFVKQLSRNGSEPLIILPEINPTRGWLNKHFTLEKAGRRHPCQGKFYSIAGVTPRSDNCLQGSGKGRTKDLIKDHLRMMMESIGVLAIFAN